MEEFVDFYNHGFVRIAAGIPRVRVADPAFNSKETIALMREAAEIKASLSSFLNLAYQPTHVMTCFISEDCLMRVLTA